MASRIYSVAKRLRKRWNASHQQSATLQGEIYRCPVGCAVVTDACGNLTPSFSKIVHAVAPLLQPREKFSSSDRNALVKCYISAMRLAYEYADVAVLPLLGSGARGWSTDDSAHALAAAVQSIHASDAENILDVQIAVRDDRTMGVVCDALSGHIVGGI